ncbi:MAG TPA: SIS domain-containing protein [Candidatus Fimivivens sp.]|nr:SIS domain-containing protein [Candidatus Fimivivens sp.]
MNRKLSEFATFANSLSSDGAFLESVESATRTAIHVLKSGGTLFVCGNGGSATQASHMVGELVGRFRFDRPALPAISLFDLATTTAIGNDYGYDEIFSRFVVGLGKRHDILFSLSTSGNSKNCIRAIEEASKKGMKTVSLLGRDGGEMKAMSDTSIVVPSDDTPTIQEIHLMILHDLCDRIERDFFGNNR